MRSFKFALVVIIVGLAISAPVAAFAASSDISVDFTSGSMGALFGVVKGVAKDLLYIAMMIGLFLEFIRPPGESRSFSVVVARVILVVVGLNYYQQIFGQVFVITDAIAEKVSPNTYALQAYLNEQVALRWRALDDPMGQFAPADGGGHCEQNQVMVCSTDSKGAYTCKCTTASDTSNSGGSLAGRIGKNAMGFFFDGVMTIFFGIMGAARFIIERLGRILAGVYFLIGPLALVASIPRSSGTAGNWFRYFVVYCSWPIFTGILMSLIVHIGAGASATGSNYGTAIAASLVYALSMFAVPGLASHIIGGSGGHIVAAGFASFKNVSGTATNYVGGAASSVKSFVQRFSGTEKPDRPLPAAAGGGGGSAVPSNGP